MFLWPVKIGASKELSKSCQKDAKFQHNFSRVEKLRCVALHCNSLQQSVTQQINIREKQTRRYLSSFWRLFLRRLLFMCKHQQVFGGFFELLTFLKKFSLLLFTLFSPDFLQSDMFMIRTVKTKQNNNIKKIKTLKTRARQESWLKQTSRNGCRFETFFKSVSNCS